MKEKTKKLVGIFLSVAMTFSITACDGGLVGTNSSLEGAITQEFETKTYSSGEKFVFFADLPPTVDARGLDIYKEAGFTDYILIPWDSYNASYNESNPDNSKFATALNLLEEKGLGAYVRRFGAVGDFEWMSGMDFSKYSAYRGFYVVDEPSATQFDELGTELVPYWNGTYADNGYWHLNLFPSYASNYQLGTEADNGKSSYENYIDQYVEKVLSKVEGEKGIGMDHYGLRVRGNEYYISDMLYYDLMTVAQAAKRTNSTLHNCIQTSTGHTSTRILTTAAELRWQYYLSMAFGAKIFEAFAYMDDANLKFDCMVGKKLNDLYYFHQEVSAELKRFEDVFLAFDWEGVKTFVGSENEFGYNAGFDPIKKNELDVLTNVKSVKGTQDTLVGQFNCSGDKAYLLLNCSDPVYAEMDRVTMTFNNCDKIMVYRGGRLAKYVISNNELTLDLIGGEGVFVIPVVE